MLDLGPLLRRHQPNSDCECHCERCYEALEKDPIYHRFYARCGGCFGGDEADGEAWRGEEAYAYEREQQAEIQRTLK